MNQKDFDSIQDEYDKELDRQRRLALKHRRKNIKKKYTRYFVNLLRLADRGIWVDLDFKNEKQHKIRKKPHPRRER